MVTLRNTKLIPNQRKTLEMEQEIRVSVDYRFCVSLLVPPYDFRAAASVDSFVSIDIW